MKTQVTIIGFGNMGRAISEAIKKNDRQVKVFGIDKEVSNPDAAVQRIKKSDFIILAVKPQDARQAIGQIKNHINQKAILVSIMAGISINKLGSLSEHKKIIRMMPNMGLSVGEGIAAWKSAGLSGLDLKKAKSFLNLITENFEVKNEDTINKVTAISGSGPAYFFLLADSLIKACHGLGLSKEESRLLVEKTFSASAMLGQDGDYSALIKNIASPGGTTEAALKIFKKNNFEKTVLQAVQAAHKRANELSHG